MNTDIGLKLTKVIEANPQKVFNAWLDENLMKQFMVPAGGIKITEVEIDPKVGGYLGIMMNANGYEMPHSGMYKVLEKYRKLSFTWISSFVQVNTLVTLSFEAITAGPSQQHTRLTIEHVGFLNDQNKTDHQFGWITIIENLTRVLS